MLEFVSYYSVFLPFLLFLLYRKKMVYADKLIFAYTCLVILAEISIEIYQIYDKYTYNVIHVYMFSEVFIFTYLIKHLMNSKFLNRLYWWILSFYYVVAVINTIYFEPFDTFNSTLRSIENILIILFCLFFFYRLFVKSEIVYLQNYPYFWAVSGMLIHFSGTLFIYTFAKYMATETAVYLWGIHSILNILLNLLLAYTLWLSNKDRKYK